MFTKNAYKVYVHQKCIQSVCSPKMHTRRMFTKNAYKAYVHQKCMESVCPPKVQLLGGRMFTKCTRGGVCSPKMHTRRMFTKNAYKVYVHQKCIQGVCSSKMHTRRMFTKNAWKVYVHQGSSCLTWQGKLWKRGSPLCRKARECCAGSCNVTAGCAERHKMLCRKLQRDSWLCRKARECCAGSCNVTAGCAERHIMLCRKLKRGSWLCRKAWKVVQEVATTWQLVVQKGTKCLRVSTFGSVSYLAWPFFSCACLLQFAVWSDAHLRVSIFGSVAYLAGGHDMISPRVCLALQSAVWSDT